MKHKKIKYDVNEGTGFANMAPKLNSIQKTKPFKVNANYFDKLPEEIIAKITERENKSITKNLLNSLLMPRYAIPVAASIILILITIFVFDKPASVINYPLIQYSFDDILLESPEIIESMDESLLIETLFAENGEENGSTLTLDELDDYLSEENLTPEIFNEY
jgi:hypothetical protein